MFNNNKFRKDNEYKSVLVITHYFATGPAIELKDYLISRTNELFFIRHPFSFALGDKRSTYEYYKNGQCQEKKFFPISFKINVLFYIKDFIASLYFVLTSKKNIEVCIAADNLNCLSVLLLKKLGKVKKVIFYSIDYTPQRFNNFFLNLVYQTTETFCYNHADINWVGTEKTIKARAKNGIFPKNNATTIIVPDGNHALKIKKKKISKIDRNTMVYVGYIYKRQGLDLVIKSLPRIKKKYRMIKLIVIGTGEYLPELKKLVDSLNLNKTVKFYGFIENHKKIEDIVSSCAIGIATYLYEKNSHTNFSESGKPKLYLGCGLPVIITPVAGIAAEINLRKAGIVIPYSEKEFIDAVYKMLQNRKVYESYKNNATQFGLQFDWSLIFKKALEQTKKLIV